MKRILSLILAALMLLSLLALSACGNSRRVPDSVLERDGLLDSPYLTENGSYKLDTKHHLDKHAHVDDITQTMTVKEPFGTFVYSRQFSYRYDRSTDLWSLCSGSTRWDLESEKYNYDHIGKQLIGTWESKSTSDPDSYTVTITECKDGIIYFDYTYSAKAIAKPSDLTVNMPDRVTITGSSTVAFHIYKNSRWEASVSVDLPEHCYSTHDPYLDPWYRHCGKTATFSMSGYITDPSSFFCSISAFYWCDRAP